MLNVISVDVEDYFHPSEVCHLVDPHGWDKMPSRIEAATDGAGALAAGLSGVAGPKISNMFARRWVRFVEKSF
jgi:hypothetical protein